MRHFEIECMAIDGFVKRYFVKAKTYEAACVQTSKLDGDGTFKLLGVFEQSEVDKNVYKRIG